jgi:hypothetical protein
MAPPARAAPHPCSFVILVSGTLVYGRGDEEEGKQELEAALASGAIPAEAATAAAPVDEEAAPLLAAAAAAAAAPAAIPARSVPVGIRAAAASPHVSNAMMGSSLKATMTITHGSYSRSLSAYSSMPRGSLGRQGSLSRRLRRDGSEQDEA